MILLIMMILSAPLAQASLLDDYYSPLGQSLEIAFDKLKLALVVDDAKNIEKSLDVASERIRESGDYPNGSYESIKSLDEAIRIFGSINKKYGGATPEELARIEIRFGRFKKELESSSIPEFKDMGEFERKLNLTRSSLNEDLVERTESVEKLEESRKLAAQQSIYSSEKYIEKLDDLFKKSENKEELDEGITDSFIKLKNAEREFSKGNYLSSLKESRESRTMAMGILRESI